MQMIASYLQEEDEPAPSSFLSSFWGVKNFFSPPVAPLLSSPLRGKTMFANCGTLSGYISVLKQQNFDSKHLPSISPPRLQPIHMESSVVRVFFLWRRGDTYPSADTFSVAATEKSAVAVCWGRKPSCLTIGLALSCHFSNLRAQIRCCNGFGPLTGLGTRP